MKNFLGGVLLFGAIFFVVKNIGLVSLILESDLSIYEILLFFFYSFVSISPIFLPMATIIANISTLGYMNHTQELFGFYISGRKFTPYLLLLISLSLFVSIFNFLVEEKIHYGLKTLLTLKEKLGSFPIVDSSLLRIGDDKYMWIGRIEEKGGIFWGEDVCIWQLADNIGIHAKRAKLLYSKDKKDLYLQLYDGVVYKENEELYALNFKKYKFFLPIINKQSLESDLSTLPSHLIRAKLKELGKSEYFLEAELNKRYTIFLAPFVTSPLVLIFALSLKVSGSIYSFAFSNIFIIAYYLLFILGNSLSKALVLPILLWLPNIVFLIVGVIFYFKIREKI